MKTNWGQEFEIKVKPCTAVWEVLKAKENGDSDEEILDLLLCQP